MLGPIGWTEILVILLIVVIIFGAKRLPQLGRGMGEALKNFKGAVREDNKKDKDDSDSTDA